MSFFFDVLPAMFASIGSAVSSAVGGTAAAVGGTTASAGALGISSGLTYGAATLPATFSAVGGAAGSAAAAASAAAGGVGLAAGAGLTAAQIASLGIQGAGLVSSGLGVASSISAANAEKGAVGLEGDYAMQAAQAEADAQARDDRRLRSRGVSLYAHGGVQRGEGSPLLYELETAREIGQRYSDRLYRGQVSRYGSSLQLPAIQATRNARVGSIATGYFRSLLS